MQATTFPSTLRSDKTIATAWMVVALFGAAQLFAVAFFYAEKARTTRAMRTPSITASATNPSGVGKSLPAVATDGHNPAAPSISSLAQPPASIGNTSPADRFLREAKALRDRGDTTNALNLLQEVARLEPKNANALAEMALIYESMQSFDRSNETWRRLQEIGVAAGPLYELADMKLKLGVPAGSSAASGTASTNPVAAPADATGIPDGSTFGITEAIPAEATDPDADTHLVLKVGVKARPNTPIDYTKVKIQVFFYDMVDNDRVVLTDADVSYEWLTPHHNWSDTNPEMLAVTYVRPKKDALSSDAALTAAAAAVTPSASAGRKNRSRTEPPPETPAEPAGQRKYLGYIVRVYYKDQLQAVRAEPVKLLNQFPPPFTAPQ